MRIAGRRAFTLVELLVVIAIIGILVGLTFPTLGAIRETARRTQCNHQMRQLTVACINYQSRSLKFPAGISPVRLQDGSIAGVGKSWQVAIFPYIESGNLANELNSEISQLQDDQQLVDRFEEYANRYPVQPLLCPSSPGLSARANVPNRTGFASHYIGNAGPGANTPESNYETYATSAGPIGLDGIFSPFTPNVANSQPVFSNRFAVQISDIVDGLSNTILVGESSRRTSADGNFVGHRAAWSFGGVGEYSATARGFVPSQLYSVRSVGANRINEPRDYLANPEFQNTHCFNSNHPGGAIFATADGSCRFVADTIDVNTLIHLSSICGREIVGDFE